MDRVWTLDELLAVTRRGELREAGDWLDGPGRALRPALVEAARARGVVVDPDWPGKRLLRRARGLEASAQAVHSPVQRDEAFTCASCGAEVPTGGRRPRDHCPWCLWSLHVDVVPGDRAAGCGGLLRPVGTELRHGVLDILYTCERCGAPRRNRRLDDVDPPDDPRVVYRLQEEAARSGRLG